MLQSLRILRDPQAKSECPMRTVLDRCRLVIAVLGLVVLLWPFRTIDAAVPPTVPEGVPDDLKLLRMPPFDTITLSDRTVLEIEPIMPRGLLDEPEPEQEDKRPKTLIIHLVEGDVRDFQIETKHIREIIYFEDQLVEQGDKLMLNGEFLLAFEHYLRAYEFDSDMEGLSGRVNTLLYNEGVEESGQGRTRQALKLFRELHSRTPDYPDLDSALARSYDAQVDAAIRASDYAKARRIVRDLESKIGADNRSVVPVRGRLLEQARRLVRRAEDRRVAQATRLDLLTEAVAVWPQDDTVASAYREAFLALPTLTVGVDDLASRVSPWLHSDAERRVAELIYVPLLADTSEDALLGKSPDQIAEQVEVSDLGRELVVTVRDGITWSDGSRDASPTDVARILIDRANPKSDGFQASWANLLERVEIGRQSVTVRLRRSTLEPTRWMVLPIMPAHADDRGRVTVGGGRTRPVGNGPFRWIATNGPTTTYRRVDDVSADPTVIQRVVEIRLPDPEDALAALINGKVSLLEHVPPNQVAILQRLSEIRVGRYRDPVLHWIALDGRNPALKNRRLRRALSLAIPRTELLEDVLLKAPAGPETGELSDGPFIKGSYADRTVEPLEHDPLLARMLVAAAADELNRPRIDLTFAYPATTVAKAVAFQLVEAFEQAGLNIQTVETPAAELENRLRTGAQFDLVYRTGLCREPIADIGPVLCPGYNAPPEVDAIDAIASLPVLQALLRLEQVTSWPKATELAAQLDMLCVSELPIIPLWQLTDHYAWRDRLDGPPEQTEHLYQTLPQWRIQPWFATDAPDRTDVATVLDGRR